MQLHDAITQISEIRSHLARTETFRGYRAATVAGSGVLAWLGAAAQLMWLPRPVEQISGWLALWVSIASASLAMTAGEMWLRCRRSRSAWTVRLTRLAAEQFLPSVAAGGLVTAVLVGAAPEALWMLPGLWAVFYGLGVFASWRLLPRPIAWAGAYYLASGAVVLAVARNEWAFSPWAMAGTFGVGQLIIAAILYLTLERKP
ncbi:MAG TPA: hypothetical protein VML55_25065 [Planctomycetaceae bacterium]|nr:hypothetical protein [Planctomycetaceae bacterium]